MDSFLPTDQVSTETGQVHLDGLRRRDPGHRTAGQTMSNRVANLRDKYTVDMMRETLSALVDRCLTYRELAENE